MSSITHESFAERCMASVRIKWLILKTAMEERLVYRGDFAFSTLVRFLPIVTQIFLWNAIFAGDTQRQMNGYSYPAMVTYYLLVMVARAFSSMPGLANGIAMSVRDGSVRKYLLQPVDMLGYLFWHRIAHKLVYYAVGDRTLSAGVLALSRLPAGLASARRDGRLGVFTADGFSDWISDRILDRTDFVLVSGNQFADLYLHDDELLSFRSHDSAGMACGMDSVGLLPAGLNIWPISPPPFCWDTSHRNRCHWNLAFRRDGLLCCSS